jgi:hypothetical protein
MRGPGASSEPREQPGDNEDSSTQPTGPASPPGAGGLGSSPDADGEAAVPVNPHGGAEKHADRAPRTERKGVAGTSGESQGRHERKRRLDSKPAESFAQPFDARAAQRARSSSRESETHQAPTPERRDRTAPPSQPHGQPELTEAGSGDILAPVADAREPDRCAIIYKTGRHRGQFDVIVTENDGSSRCVARSVQFRAPRFGALRPWGAARVAHQLVVSRLAACGWWSVQSGGAWHELGFVRARPAGMRTRRSLVMVVREAGQARFVAEELDAYGNPTPLMVSAPFGTPRFLSVRPSTQARRSLEQLVRRLESEGWKVAAAVGKNWYGISLWRPVSTNEASRARRSR